MKTINYSTIERYARRLERENLKRHGTSLSWVSMLRHVKVLCIHNGTNTVDVEDDWREELKKVVLKS